MPNYKLTIAYDGTNYAGWQIQPNAVSIQEKIQNSLSIFLREKIHIIGSGRTDAGAHAMGQVANFHISKEIDQRRFLFAANGILPDDIRILSIEEVPEDFHSRFSATKKEYRYFIRTAQVQTPFRRLYSFHYYTPMEIEKIKECIPLFIGTHDFTSVANIRGPGQELKSAVRTIDRLDLIEKPDELEFVFVGSGFLYKMVRNIMGLLIETASGKRTVEEVKQILNAKDRRKAGRAAPSHGLFLMQVEYGVK